jgi:glycolate oxidase iron-sulfur subunit
MTPAFVRHFDACLGCMACVTACPSGVQYAPLIEATRGQIERRHPRDLGTGCSARDLRVVPYPARLRLALLPAVLYRLVQPILLRTGVLRLLPGRLRALAALAPPVTLANLMARTPERTPAAGTRRMTVGLLTGCVQRLVFGT